MPSDSSPATPSPRLPSDRIIANGVTTVLALLIFGGFACGFGSLATPLAWRSKTSAGYRIFRVTGVGLQLEFAPPHPAPSFGPGKPRAYQTADGRGSGFNILGVEYSHDMEEWRNAAIRWQNTTIGFPYWPFVAYFLAPPIFRGLCRVDQRRLRPKKKLDLSHCLVCGYDLRATPRRCPECGAPRGSTVKP